MEHKKIYNGFLAYLYTDGLTVMVVFGLLAIVILFLPADLLGSRGETVTFGTRLAYSGCALLIAAFGWLISRPAASRIKKYSTPETVGQHKRECYFTGWKIAWKVTFFAIALFLPGLIKWSIGYPVTGVDKDGNEVWLKPLGDGVYEDPHGDRYTLN